MNSAEIVSFTFSFFILILPYTFNKKKNPSNVAGIVMTLGVLGTFAGILWGLFDFNANAVEESVPVLLNGLRFAFLTSIVGMISGLILKILPGIYGFKVDKETHDATIDDIVINLKEIAATIKQSSETENSQLKNIEKALTGEGDTTLLTQMQKMRMAFNDKQDDLIKEFKMFAEKMAENNSKALMEALTEVMKDFNTQINEQLGDNFKKLNESVEKLLIWQDNYKEHIEKLESHFKVSVDSIERSSVVTENIINKIEVFKDSADQLKNILEANDTQVKGLEEFLKGFKKIASDSEAVVPIIEKSINNLITDFDKINKQFDEQNKNVIKLQESLNKEMTESVSRVNKQWNTLIEANQERIANQIQVLDKALEDELRKSLSTFAGQLASLSQKFVEDYSPLTDQLVKVVNIAKGLES